MFRWTYRFENNRSLIRHTLGIAYRTRQLGSRRLWVCKCSEGRSKAYMQPFTIFTRIPGLQHLPFFWQPRWLPARLVSRPELVPTDQQPFVMIAPERFAAHELGRIELRLRHNTRWKLVVVRWMAEWVDLCPSSLTYCTLVAFLSLCGCLLSSKQKPRTSTVRPLFRVFLRGWGRHYYIYGLILIAPLKP